MECKLHHGAVGAGVSKGFIRSFEEVCPDGNVKYGTSCGPAG